MGPLIPVALGAVALYGIKRFFDTKTAPASTAPPYQGDVQPGPGGAQGGGGGAPGDPGYPMNADPTYNPQPMTMGQMSTTLKALTAPRLATSKTIAQQSPNTLGTFTSRAASIPSTYLASGPTPASAPPSPTLTALSSSLAPAPSPLTTSIVKALGGKTLSK